MRRAPYVEEACAKLRVSAGRRRSQRRGAPCELAVGKRVGLCLGGAVSGCSSGRDRAHARHMRRRTSGLCQLTLPPRSISRRSSASLPSLAASHTALSIESLSAPAALYRPSPAPTPAHSGGARSAPPIGRRRRALRRGAHAARPHAPRSSGVRGSRAGARARRGRSKRPLPQRLAPEAPSSVVWACEAAVAPNVCDAGHRARRGHRAREWEAIPAVKEGNVPHFPRPRRREACRADAHGNRPPSQLVVNPVRRVSGRERSEGRKEGCVGQCIPRSACQREAGHRARRGHWAIRPREGWAEITASMSITFFGNMFNRCERAVKVTGDALSN